MPLNAYLKRAGVVTGSLTKNTSASALERLKNSLCGKKQFQGDEAFLVFGNSLHQQLLENKNSYQVTPDEATRIAKMLTKLRAHPVVKSLLANSVREQKCYSELNGISVAFILDIKKPQISTGADLKTTTCSSMRQCVEKARVFGYFRQSKIYKLCAKLKHFYFIFVQKEEPHEVFIVDVSMYPEEERYAERELEFLLYFYKHYGNFNKPITTTNGDAVSQQVNAVNSKVNAMAKTGKEQLALVKEAATEHKKNLSAANKAVVLAEKSKAKLKKLIEGFPVKERELYEEKLEKFSQE